MGVLEFHIKQQNDSLLLISLSHCARTCVCNKLYNTISRATRQLNMLPNYYFYTIIHTEFEVI